MDSLIIRMESQLTHSETFMLQTLAIIAFRYLIPLEDSCSNSELEHREPPMESLVVHMVLQLTLLATFMLQTLATIGSKCLIAWEHFSSKSETQQMLPVLPMENSIIHVELRLTLKITSLSQK